MKTSALLCVGAISSPSAEPRRSKNSLFESLNLTMLVEGEGPFERTLGRTCSYEAPFSKGVEVRVLGPDDCSF